MSAPVAVVLAPLDIPPRALAGYWENLSHDERARAARFHRETDRARFVAAHGMLRAVLGRAAACAPAALEFARNAFGKPYLVHDGAPHPLRFNLSHGGGLLLIAFGLGRDVGVDVERPRAVSPCDLESVIAQACCAEEQAALFAVPPAQRAPAFHRLWVRREALAKAQGTGFACAPRPGGIWPVRDLDLGAGVFAAVAAEGAGLAVKLVRGGGPRGIDRGIPSRYSPPPIFEPGTGEGDRPWNRMPKWKRCGAITSTSFRSASRRSSPRP